jgi:predicted nucleic acid-binding Zn ribbon protein
MEGVGLKPTAEFKIKKQMLRTEDGPVCVVCGRRTSLAEMPCRHCAWLRQERARRNARRFMVGWTLVLLIGAILLIYVGERVLDSDVLDGLSIGLPIHRSNHSARRPLPQLTLPASSPGGMGDQ